MRIWNEQAAGQGLRGSVAAIGFFDGVHRGHRYLIGQVEDAAARRGLASAVVTFPVHPRKVVQAACPPLLTTGGEKLELLAGTGLDYCLLLDFTPALAALSAGRFMALLKERYKVQVLLVGHDHRFGHNRSESFADYVRHAAGLGMEVLPVSAFQAGGNGEISSSRIRSLLHAGHVQEAARLLGYEYFLQGTVAGGHRVGRTIGFPTANLRVDDAGKLVPSDGVYAVRVQVDGKQHGGMLSIGFRPTFHNGADRSIEAYIFDFHADIYNRPMRISFVRRVRGELKFESAGALAEQLRKDEKEVRGILLAGS